MNANELMIGDWVQNPHGYKVQVKDIRWIREDKSDGYGDFYLIDVVRGRSYKSRLEEGDINPIPLTADILKGNGLHAKTGPCGLFQLMIDGVNCSVNFCIIHYVHELQHALRLAGIDKEIILED